MRTREELIRHIESGASPKFLFFWGHTQKKPDVSAGFGAEPRGIDASCLSQWFPRAFVIDGVRYASAEHYMMASKALVFGDKAAFARVLSAATPAEAKKIGRE